MIRNRDTITDPLIDYYRMVLTLEKRGLIERVSGRPRSIRALLTLEELPVLDHGD